MKKIIILLMLTSLFVFGCKNKKEEPGIVARVNGKPVYLSQLDYKYDLMHDGSAGFIPSVSQVRSEYGQILGDIIVQELVSQELEEQNIPVSDKELKEAEDEVRSDYPENAFEQILIEEYIDLNSWRSQLKYQLAMDKFFSQILRPEIKIDYKEAEEYYRTHLSDFYMQAGFKFIMIKGFSRDLVTKGVEQFRKGVSPEEISNNLKQVTVREIWVRNGQLPTTWEPFVQELDPGKASPVITQEKEFICLILKEKKDATLLTPLQAYPAVEKVLLERKLDDKFELWLKNKLANSNIKISKELLPQQKTEKPVPVENKNTKTE
ncbi:SurA N-terminal domain-containing protein [Maridesulfovibrio ferrireducens]|uniref:SurA N-terminal domain-containing protein n=1 Tax=Maridesulfovibrio ferrireducens TaxID=246191 RepID=A0A1G9I4S6_9BACT|nr:SurA N-terminal domain-containing protein [Maridesulfovibrio ferrireducens]SDL20247.1 SurA N-terminal domain-containing protein [Maridesulfovibrio ferrireducens]